MSWRRAAIVAASLAVADAPFCDLNRGCPVANHIGVILMSLCSGRRLVVAAQQGAAAEAEEVIEDMRTAGLAPGARAYHGLIFSHSKVCDGSRRNALQQRVQLGDNSALSSRHRCFSLLKGYCPRYLPTVCMSNAARRYRAPSEHLRGVCLSQLGFSESCAATLALIDVPAQAGDADAALDVVREAYDVGIQPLPESYVVLIHAFVQQDRLEDAELVLVSMRRAGLEARQGWLMLTEVRNGRVCRVLRSSQGRYTRGDEESSSSKFQGNPWSSRKPSVSICIEYRRSIDMCCIGVWPVLVVLSVGWLATAVSIEVAMIQAPCFAPSL